MDEEIKASAETRGVSRRKMLKRIGTGAAIAWTAPILTSIRTPAFAGSAPCSCVGDPCGCQTPCDGGNCFCNQNVTDGVPNGKTHCTVPTDCTNQDCRNDSDCPSGQVCQATCCANPKCFVLCDPAKSRRVGTVTSVRR